MRSYCQIWFSECGLCQVGKLGVRPGSWFSPKSSHGRFMMAFGGRSSSDVFGEVLTSTRFTRSINLRPVGTWLSALLRVYERKFGLSFYLRCPLEVGLGFPKCEHQNGDLPCGRNGCFAETFSTSQSECPRFEGRKSFDVSD